MINSKRNLSEFFRTKVPSNLQHYPESSKNIHLSVESNKTPESMINEVLKPNF